MNKMEFQTTDGLPTDEQKSIFGTKKWVFTGLLAGLIGILSSTVNFAEPSSYRLPVTGMIIGLMLLMTGFRLGNVSKQGLILMFFWTGYSACCFASAIINNDILAGEAWQLFGVQFLIFFAVPFYAKRHGIRMVALGIVWGFAPYIAISLILHPLKLSYYAGVFENPNTMGMVLVALLAGLLSLLRGFITEAKRQFFSSIYMVVLVLGILATLILIVASSSRTSLSTAGLLLLIFVWSLFLDAAKNRLWVKMVIIGTSIFLVFIMLAGNTVGSGVFGDMLKKFDRGLISGRYNIWQTAINEATIFGHGNWYFLHKFGMVAHNNYIDVLGAKGIIALCFRVPFDLLVVFMAFRLAAGRVQQDGYAVGPLLVVVCYLVVGFGETVNGTLGHGIHISYLLMSGMVINYYQYHHRGNQ